MNLSSLTCKLGLRGFSISVSSERFGASGFCISRGWQIVRNEVAGLVMDVE